MGETAQAQSSQRLQNGAEDLGGCWAAGSQSSHPAEPHTLPAHVSKLLSRTGLLAKKSPFHVAKLNLNAEHVEHY